MHFENRHDAQGVCKHLAIGRSAKCAEMFNQIRSLELATGSDARSNAGHSSEAKGVLRSDERIASRRRMRLSVK